MLRGKMIVVVKHRQQLNEPLIHFYRKHGLFSINFFLLFLKYENVALNHWAN